MNFIINALMGASGNTSGGENALDPIYAAADIILPVMLGLILVAGLIYAVVIGTQFSKAADAAERDNAKKKLINAAIGFISILVLIALLWVLKEPLMNAMNSTK